MSNRFRTEIQDEEAEQELIVEEKQSKALPDNFLTQFLKNGVVTSEDVTRALPFVFLHRLFVHGVYRFKARI
jgi:hypothetical protein